MKIQVNLNCPQCKKALLFNKDEEKTTCQVRCPRCGSVLKMRFDTSVSPQTFEIFEVNTPKPEPEEPQAPKKPRCATKYVSDQELQQPPVQPGQVTASRHTDPGAPAGYGPGPGVAPERPSGKRNTVNIKPGRMTPPPPPRRDPAPRYSGPSGASLVRKHLFRKEYFDLYHGVNIIGRDDATDPSDIGISGDPLVSRRSVSIDVLVDEYGFEARLKVLRALNPVKVNGLMVYVGQEQLLYDGDKLTLGDTTLIFKYDRK